jgi:tetratricopeptide (TPR) repeat protein
VQETFSPAQLDQIAARGDSLYAQGNFQQALLHFSLALKHQPAVAQHAYRAGLALWRLGQPEAAKQSFERAIRLNPAFPHAHGELSRVLLTMGHVGPALRHAQKAVELAPDDPSLAVALASVLQADPQSEATGAIIDRLLKSGHESTDLAMVFARAAVGNARSPEAIELIERLLAKLPPLSIPEQSALHFSAANLLDAAGRYDDAFAHASAANALRQASYDPAQTEASFSAFIDYFSRAKIDSAPRPANASDLPIFIVGMPRSGTSLIEQILASHPAIHGGGELNWIARVFESAVQRGAGGNPPTLESLDGLTASDVNLLADEYLKPLRALNPSARHVTDKMPTNFIYLGLIAMLFPKAKIIHCRRDALDTCLSCFMTDFAAGYEFSFDLPSLGHFYRQYQRTMSHWKSALDLQMLEVDYEQLVANLEAEARRMLAFLNLPWDPACLQFHENKRFAGTASHQQVRKPVYRSSVGRWRNYGKFLGPLREEFSLPL